MSGARVIIVGEKGLLARNACHSNQCFCVREAHVLGQAPICYNEEGEIEIRPVLSLAMYAICYMCALCMPFAEKMLMLII